MGTLPDLIDKLYEVLGENTEYTVYGKAPTNTTLSYPCIVIKLDTDHVRRADNRPYMKLKKYTLTLITSDIFDNTYDKLVDNLPYCRFENNYISDQLYHYKLVLYY